MISCSLTAQSLEVLPAARCEWKIPIHAPIFEKWRLPQRGYLEGGDLTPIAVLE
jgi:hypothetical protein